MYYLEQRDMGDPGVEMQGNQKLPLQEKVFHSSKD